MTDNGPTIDQLATTPAGPPQFLVLLGIDGSGKSTLLPQLATPTLATTSWHDLRSHEVPATLAPEEPTAIKNRLSPLGRAMFIGGHLVAQYEFLVRPSLLAGKSLLLDSYYFKLLAKERLLGFVHPAFEQLCAELPAPDGVIYVEVAPELSRARKRGVLSKYEYFPERGENSYVDFQRALGDSIRHQISSLPHVILDGTQEPTALADHARLAIAELARIKEPA